MSDARLPAARILLVDDEPVLLTLLCRMLEGEGFHVTGKHTAEQALAWLEAERGSELVVADATIPYTVVSDVRLPEMNGCSLGREIAKRWPDTRMLFISGYIAEELFARRICPGNLPLLPKPFRIPEFLDAVRKILAAPPWVPDSWPEPEGEFA
jgi:two-component system cell cycle sensor histidine kinase/response regulator CckA